MRCSDNCRKWDTKEDEGSGEEAIFRAKAYVVVVVPVLY